MFTFAEIWAWEAFLSAGSTRRSFFHRMDVSKNILNVQLFFVAQSPSRQAQGHPVELLYRLKPHDDSKNATRRVPNGRLHQFRKKETRTSKTPQGIGRLLYLPWGIIPRSSHQSK